MQPEPRRSMKACVRWLRKMWQKRWFGLQAGRPTYASTKCSLSQPTKRQFTKSIAEPLGRARSKVEAALQLSKHALVRTRSSADDVRMADGGRLAVSDCFPWGTSLLL